MITKDMQVALGTTLMSSLKASSPPADAPIPTTGNKSLPLGFLVGRDFTFCTAVASELKIKMVRGKGGESNSPPLVTNSDQI